MKKRVRSILCVASAIAVLLSCVCPTFAAAAEANLDGRVWINGNGNTIILPSFDPDDYTTSTTATLPAGMTENESLQESATPYVVVGSDDRNRILDSDVYPNSPIVFLELHHSTSTRYGTGFYVAPDIIVTAAHNIDDYGDEVVYVNVTPGGEDNTIAHFSVFRSSIYVPREWHENYNQNYDYAIICLTSSSVGNIVGSLTLSAFTDAQLSNLEINVKGFPGDKDLGTLWSGVGTVTRCYTNLIYYNADTYGGQSGGPIVLESNHQTVVGINAYEVGSITATDEDDINYGVRVTANLIAMVTLAANNGLEALT